MISSHPAIITMVILVVTAALGGAYVLLGGEMEATEETFMPSNEVVEASNQIGRLFTTSELVQILAKGNGGNVLTPESITEILKVEKEIVESEDISYLLLDESNPLRVSSIGDTIVQASGLLETIRGMVEGIGPQFQQTSQVMGQISGAIRLSREGIENSLGTPYLGQAIIGANSTIMELVSQLAMMGGGPPGSMPGMSDSPQTSGPNFEQKIGFFENMSTNDIRDLIETIVNYDEAYTDTMVTAVLEAIETTEGTLEEIGQLNQTLLLAAQDPSIAQDLQAQMALGMIGFTTPLLNNGISMVLQQAVEMDVEKLESQLDSGMDGIGRGIRLSLTKDFSPDNGTYTAEGTLLMIGFNASLARAGEEGSGFAPPGSNQENMSRMLRAQEAMVEIIDGEELRSTSMIVIAMDITSREILEATQDSFSILLPAAFLLVIIVLGLVYRNILDMVISLLALGFAIVWTYGIGTLAGFVFNPMTLAVPVVIAGLGIDYGIHLTLRYKEEKSNGQSPRDSARISIGWVGSALLIATLTTLAAFAANLTSEMAALRDFGILLGIGIASAFVIMVTFVPSIRQMADGRSKSTQSGASPEKKRRGLSSARILGTGAVAAEHHPKIVIGVTLLVTVLALFGAMQLETKFELIDFLPDDLEYAREIKFVFEAFNATAGSASANILIEGDITSPSVLNAIETTTLNMADNKLVAKKATPIGDRPDVTSIMSLMKDVATDESLTDPLDLYDQEFEEMYRSSLDDGDEVPDRDVGSLLSWLYGSNKTSGTTKGLLHRNSDGVFDFTVIRIAITSDDFESADELLAELEVDVTPLDALADGDELEGASVTGSSIMIKQIISSLQDSLTTSFIFTLIVSFAILTIVFFITERSFVLGGITMIPVLLSSAWILGSMYALGIPYTVMTVMVTALTVGLGVTYGIHLTHRFAEEMKEHGNVDEGCMETVVHTGSALFGAAATTISGFGLLVFSLLPPIQEFGEIVALAIVYSFLTTVFILPTFLVMWARRTTRYDKSSS